MELSRGVLLDTHTLMWIDLSPERLSKTAAELVQNPDIRIFV
jgi:PIN domain nuclease of toxin-antitoxin system